MASFKLFLRRVDQEMGPCFRTSSTLVMRWSVLEALKMASGENLARGFFQDVLGFIGKYVTLVLDDKTTVYGKLKRFHPETHSCILHDATMEGKNEKIPQLLIPGRTIRAITLAEPPFDIEGLFEEIKSYFPQQGTVILHQNLGIIEIMGRVKVTENGVEGDQNSALTRRVKQIYDEFVNKQKEKISK